LSNTSALLNPYFEEKIIIDMRVKESLKAQNILGEDKITYLGLTEGKFKEEFEKKKIMKVIEKLIKDNKPSKIFTHSIDDPHPDHNAVYDLMNKVFDKIKYKGEVYTFDVWTPVNWRERDLPILAVDITKTFKKKLRAFKAHKSQLQARILLTWSIYFRAYINGRNTGFKREK